MTLDKIEVRRRDNECGSDAPMEAFSDHGQEQKNIEKTCENFIYILSKNGLDKYESYIKEGHVKGNKKSAKGKTYVEAACAFVGAAAGAPLGYIGTGASVGAAAGDVYDFFYGRIHRIKPKEIAKGIATYSIDKNTVLYMFASIAAELFRVFEHQLAPLVVNDLKIVAHDIVIRIYNAILACPDIWKEEDCARNDKVLVKSVEDRKSLLDKINRGRRLDGKETQRTTDLLSKPGIYDYEKEKYFVSNNTDSIKYKFRLRFKHEEIKSDIWNEVGGNEIGSSKPKYYVTEDGSLITRTKENAISKVIAENLEMSTKRNSEEMKNASDASKKTKIAAEEYSSNIKDLNTKIGVRDAKIAQLVEPKKDLNVKVADIRTRMPQGEEKTTVILNEVRGMAEREEQNLEKAQKKKAEIVKLGEEVSQLADFVAPKIVGVSTADSHVPNYLQREHRYKEIEQFLDFIPKNCKESSTILCIVGDAFMGKSEMARYIAQNEFQNKYIFWVNATNKEKIEESIDKAATQLKIKLSDDADSNAYWKKICSTVSSKNTLIVFDNAATYKNIANYTPWHLLPEAISPKVIVTSRNQREWKTLNDVPSTSGNQQNCGSCHDVPSIKIVKLLPFSHNECLKFVKDTLKMDGYHIEKPPDADKNVEVLGDTNEDIIKLGEKCDFVPKSLNECCSEIRDRWRQSKKRKSKRFTLTAYLKSLDDSD